MITYSEILLDMKIITIKDIAGFHISTIMNYYIREGLIVGVTLWAVLFVPVSTFGIQPRPDHFSRSIPMHL
jgi:hypothetical protein